MLIQDMSYYFQFVQHLVKGGELMPVQRFVEDFVASTRVVYAMVVILTVGVHIVIPQDGLSTNNPRRIPETVGADSQQVTGITNLKSLVYCQKYVALAMHSPPQQYLAPIFPELKLICPPMIHEGMIV